MTPAILQKRSDDVANWFGQMLLGFRHHKIDVVITSGSYVPSAGYPGGTADGLTWGPPNPQPREAAPYGMEVSVFDYRKTYESFFQAEPTSARTISKIDLDILRLESLSRRAEADGFSRALTKMDQLTWAPAYYASVIRLALQAGAHRPAAELARKARERYPNDADVVRLADLLAPLPSPVRRSPADPTLRANRNWFVHHAAQYRGQWVAVRNGELLGAAPTLRELKALVGDTRSATISKID